MACFDHLKLYIDASSRGNPGPSSISVAIYNGEEKLIYEFSKCIGHYTNNQAEYKALMKGLALCARYTPKQISVYSDCQIVLNQMKGVRRVRNRDLIPLFQKVKKRERQFEKIDYTYVKKNSIQRLKYVAWLLKQAHPDKPIKKCIVSPPEVKR